MKMTRGQVAALRGLVDRELANGPLDGSVTEQVYLAVLRSIRRVLGRQYRARAR